MGSPARSSSSTTASARRPPRRSARGRAVRYVPPGPARGLNAARNTGLRESRAPLIAFVDDDVFVPPGWLEALVEGAQRNPDAGAFGGPIRARLEGRPPRSCGREQPPITTLDLGDRRPRDRRRLGGELRGPPQRRRAGRAVRRVDHATARRRGGVARAAAPRRRPCRLPGGRRARPPPHRRRRTPATAGQGRLRSRARRAGERRPARERAVGGARAARARGLRLAHAAGAPARRA